MSRTKTVLWLAETGARQASMIDVLEAENERLRQRMAKLADAGLAAMDDLAQVEQVREAEAAALEREKELRRKVQEEAARYMDCAEAAAELVRQDPINTGWCNDEVVRRLDSLVEELGKVGMLG